MSNLWIMTGERNGPADVEREMARLAGVGIEAMEAEILSIDPEARSVVTTAGGLSGDHLVIALGADKNSESVPGLAEAALNLYDPEGALQIQHALEEFTGGRIVVLISRTPFSCPAAPYEAAFLIDSALRERGLRDSTELALYTPEDQPMLVAGPTVGPALVEMLEERGIELHWQEIAMKIDSAEKRILFELEDTAFDLLVGVPPHTVPSVLSQSGLVDASGWVPVDQTTLRTKFDGVFAIGDATSVRLANGMFLPKAGVFADGQARNVAEAIAAEVNGTGPVKQYDGHGFCHIDVGNGEAAFGSGNFYGIPAPRVSMEAPSAHFRKEKEEMERSLLALLD